MVALLRFINRLSGQKGEPMSPPQPSGPKEVTTTWFDIKGTTHGQKCETRWPRHLLGKNLMTKDI